MRFGRQVVAAQCVRMEVVLRGPRREVLDDCETKSSGEDVKRGRVEVWEVRSV